MSTRRGWAVLAGAVMLTIALAGCGGSAPAQRQKLASYLRQVQRIEQRMNGPLGEVAIVARQFSRQESAQRSSIGAFVTVADRAAVPAAAAKVARLGARLALLGAPPVASHLRAMLLDLTRRQVALMRDFAGLVTFIPQFSAALTPLSPAVRRLTTALARRVTSSPAAVAASYVVKAFALRSFAATADAIVRRLRSLRPTAISRPGYLAQLQSLTHMSATGKRLAAALQAQMVGQVRPLLVAFDRAATLTQTIGAQRAQIAAIRSYDASIKTLTKLVNAIDLERYRLDGTLQR